jgi:hypothetical protein
MVYTTYLWWFGGGLIIVLPTVLNMTRQCKTWWIEECLVSGDSGDWWFQRFTKMRRKSNDNGIAPFEPVCNLQIPIQNDLSNVQVDVSMCFHLATIYKPIKLILYIYMYIYIIILYYIIIIYLYITVPFFRLHPPTPKRSPYNQGKLIRGAHAVDREFRVMKALNQAMWETTPFRWNRKNQVEWIEYQA